MTEDTQERLPSLHTEIGTNPVNAHNPGHDVVNKPPHYTFTDPAYETINVIEAWGLYDNYCLGNVIKYVSRAGRKGEKLEDLQKAQWYLNREIERVIGGDRGKDKA